MVSLLSRRPLRTALLTALAFGTIGFGAAYAKVHLGAHPSLPLHTVKADARQVSGRVIVIMRDQLPGQPATRAAIGKRIGAEAGVDAPVIAKVRRSGGRIRERYHALNGFAATVSDGERAALASDPAVRAVVPDQVVQLPTPPIAPNGNSSGGDATPSRTSGTQTCPSDPSHPLLEASTSSPCDRVPRAR